MRLLETELDNSPGGRSDISLGLSESREEPLSEEMAVS